MQLRLSLDSECDTEHTLCVPLEEMDENLNLSLTKDSRLFTPCSAVVRDFHASVTYGERKFFLSVHNTIKEPQSCFRTVRWFDLLQEETD